MHINKIIKGVPRYITRHYCVKTKRNITADEEVIRNIENNVYTAKRHPGIIKARTMSLPNNFIEATQNVIEDFPVKRILADSEVMCRHLKGRHIPIEADQLREVKGQIYEKVVQREFQKITDSSPENETQIQHRIKEKATRILKTQVYNWTPMTYDAYNSLVYLLGRAPAEYAVLCKIFSEIKMRDVEFDPKGLFDFGSGVGTGTWAANSLWEKKIYEFYNVDTSSFMNDLAEALLKGGRGTANSNLRGVYYRQFLPHNKVTYDLVICAYSLLELPSFHTRMQTILNLWNKTQTYLVIVEQGTLAGFKVINEVRDYIIQIEDEKNKGHVFSPCAHEHACPRFLCDDTPCNFQVKYMTMPIGAKSECRNELYSYVVLKKGSRPESDEQWPRIVRDTLVRARHSICRVCTKNGHLTEHIFTAAKNGKTTYHCARSSKWGDRLPITVNEDETLGKNEEN